MQAGDCHEVKLNIIVISPSGVFLRRSLKDFAVATMLPRNRHAAHARFIVGAAIAKAHEHYDAYCKAIAIKEMVRGAHSKYNEVEQDLRDKGKEMDV
jgi:hypothetical protein